jgi:N-methylhydantoinase A
MQEVAEAFHARHEALYTYALRDQPPVLINARVAVIGVLPSMPAEAVRPAGPPVPPRGHRAVHLGAWRDVPVFGFDEMAAGQAVAGPAIVESPTTTILLRPGDAATVTAHGWLDVAVPGGG